MFGYLPLILILLPLFFQIIYGRKAIGEDIRLKFGTVCLISLLSQTILSFIAFSIATYNFEKSFAGKEYHCGMGILGIIILAILITFVLLATILIQYFIKRSYEKR